ncbi:hypothetical protein D3C74_75550 [compost metagenome]
MKRIVTSRSLLLSLAASGLLIAANWLIFIWAVNNNHVVETSLGSLNLTIRQMKKINSKENL